MNEMNEKSELYLSDGRSFVVLKTAKSVRQQLVEDTKHLANFVSITTADGRNVYINPQFVVSITDYSYPKEDFSYLENNKKN